MAERRMFAKTIVTSDAFLDMEFSARCLYFTLGMLADDDGFVNNYKSIARQIGATKEDLDELISNKFLIKFDSGVIAIKHWKINNYLRSDRYTPTIYKEEFNQLETDEKGGYRLAEKAPTNSGIPTVYQTDTNGIHSIDKDSLELVEDSLELGNEKKERKKNIETNTQHAHTQEGNSDFSQMTDDELLAWGDNRKFDNEIPDFMTTFYAWCDECKKRRMEASKWKGKIIKNGTTFERLKSHAEIMDSWKIPNVLRLAIEEFLRHCYANGHLVTNDKLNDILYHLIEDYDTENDRVKAVGQAISGGYYDIKRYS